MKPDVALVVAIYPVPGDALGNAACAEVGELGEAVGEEVDVGGGLGAAAAGVYDL